MSAPSLRKGSATGSMSGSTPGSAGARKPSAGVKLPQIKNAADAKELEEEAAAKAAARKPKAALTPAEKRAAKLRQEQAKEGENEGERADRARCCRCASVGGAVSLVHAFCGSAGAALCRYRAHERSNRNDLVQAIWQCSRSRARSHQSPLFPWLRSCWHFSLRSCLHSSEAAAAKKLKDLKLAEVKAARRLSATSLPGTGRHSADASIPGSALPSGRGSAMGLRPGSEGSEMDGGAGGGHDDGVDFVENPDGSFSAVPRAAPEMSQAEQDDADEAAALAAAEAEKKPEENYDIIFDGPKSPLIMATAARQQHEMLRLIREVPIEYRVEFVNAYDDHGCSASVDCERARGRREGEAETCSCAWRVAAWGKCVCVRASGADVAPCIFFLLSLPSPPSATSIFFAIGPEHQDCMQLLLDFGADPNHQNNKKNGPLHIACAIQNKKAAKILIEHGANIMLENWQYQKPHEVR